MHVVIINGSPRIKKNSNTGKIISAFTRGLGANENMDCSTSCFSN